MNRRLTIDHNWRNIMDAKIQQELNSKKLIDITTIGRKSGNPHRIEIWFHNIDGKIYITGMPGRKRDWYRNMLADPHFIFHLKQDVVADLPAQATPITDDAARRAWFTRYVENSDNDVEQWIQDSPLVEVTFKE
jgi:deazaflavin-dependent oxidoreductase (nitroreductase family)